MIRALYLTWYFSISIEARIIIRSPTHIIYSNSKLVKKLIILLWQAICHLHRITRYQAIYNYRDQRNPTNLRWRLKYAPTHPVSWLIFVNFVNFELSTQDFMTHLIFDDFDELKLKIIKPWNYLTFSITKFNCKILSRKPE